MVDLVVVLSLGNKPRPRLRVLFGAEDIIGEEEDREVDVGDKDSWRSSTSSSCSSSSHHIPPLPSLYTPVTPPPAFSPSPSFPTLINLSRCSTGRLSFPDLETCFDEYECDREECEEGTAPVSRACRSATRRTFTSNDPPSSICASCTSCASGSAPAPPPGARRWAYRVCGVDCFDLGLGFGLDLGFAGCDGCDEEEDFVGWEAE